MAGCSRSQKSGVSEVVRARAAQPPLQQEGVLHLHQPRHLHLSGAFLCALRCAVRCHSEQRGAPCRLPDIRSHNGDSSGYCCQCTGERLLFGVNLF